MKTLILGFLLGWIAVGFGGPIQNMHAIVAKKRTASGYTYTSTGFGGSSHIKVAANLTGIADSKVFCFSAWIKITGGDGTTRMIMSAYDGGTNRRAALLITSTNVLNLIFRNAASAIIFDGRLASGTLTTSTGWFHLAFSGDLATTAYKIYVNGSDVSDYNANTNDTIDYNMAGGAPEWDIFGVEDGSFRVTGLVSEFYFANEYLDLSTNLTKFRTVGGKPENLGTDGSTPTGTQPLIYLKNAYSSFGTNSGSGGNWTVAGSTLTDGGADIP